MLLDSDSYLPSDYSHKFEIILLFKNDNEQDEDVLARRVFLPYAQRSVAYTAQHNMWDSRENGCVLGSSGRAAKMQRECVSWEGRRTYSSRMQLQSQV